jgi:NADPH2:quinone reductase
LHVTQIPDPVAAAGEVLVRVHASGVNPSDVKSRRAGPLAYPSIIPHSDGAGIIHSVGAGVDARRVGERVWLWNAAWRRPNGTAAELVALPATQAVPLPETISFDDGACLGIPALTAHRAVFIDGDIRGLTLLVAGGAGAVGHYACQMASRAGALVIATVSSDLKASQARAAGAAHVINYRQEDIAERVRELTAGKGVDRILEVDLAVNAAGYASYLKHDGRVIVYGSGDWTARLPQRDWLVHGVTLTFFIVYELSATARARAIDDVTRWLEAGELQHRVAARFALADIAQAHEAVEGGQCVGNVVVTI